MNPILQIIADNPALFDALQNALLDEFNTDISELEVDSLSDERLGQILRAGVMGTKEIKGVMKKILQLKKTPDTPQKVNGAR